jgi:hypothetical protein
MKRISWVLVACCLMLCLAGCQKTQKQKAEKLSVEIKNGTTFPQELAGTWICVENKWEIIIEKDGALTWALYPMGSVWIEPDKTLEVPMKMDRTSIYASGPWKAVYDQKSSILSVEIAVPFFEIAMGDDTVNGYSTDTFIGPVDIQKGVWEAKWVSNASYIVNTKELKDHHLADEDPDKGMAIFKRFDIKY